MITVVNDIDLTQKRVLIIMETEKGYWNWQFFELLGL